jgi:serine/threonine-protein kinase
MLQHPNIVQLYRAGNCNGQWWLAMEYVDGPSLRQVVAKYGVGNMLSPKQVLNTARNLATALEVAYERQVIHRNIRPENILLTKDGVAKLSDCALTRGVVLNTLQRITSTSELVGDLAYMAPERTDPDGTIDCRSDIYALGTCLYTLLTGRPPFTGRGTVQLIERIRHDEPVPPSRINLSVPGPLEAIVMRCLAKSPTDRFQTPMALREELARVARFQGMWT